MEVGASELRMPWARCDSEELERALSRPQWLASSPRPSASPRAKPARAYQHALRVLEICVVVAVELAEEAIVAGEVDGFLRAWWIVGGKRRRWAQASSTSGRQALPTCASWRPGGRACLPMTGIKSLVSPSQRGTTVAMQVFRMPAPRAPAGRRRGAGGAGGRRRGTKYEGRCLKPRRPEGSAGLRWAFDDFSVPLARGRSASSRFSSRLTSRSRQTRRVRRCRR